MNDITQSLPNVSPISADAALFFGSSGPRNARILFVGESWGDAEAKTCVPLVGQSGQEFDRMLADAGLSRADVFCTNLFNKQPAGNNTELFFYSTAEAKQRGVKAYRGLMCNDFVMESLERLYAQIEAVDPDIVVAMGNYALWALTDHCKIKNETCKYNKQGYKKPTGIMRWRGSQTWTTHGAKRRKCVPIIHPAAILRDWALRYPTVHDLRVRVAPLNKSWEPQWSFWLRPSFEKVMYFIDFCFAKCEREKTWIAVDIETRRKDIACVSLTDTLHSSICIPFMCVERIEGYWTLEEEIAIWRKLRELFSHPNFFLVGQNFNYDAQFINLYLNMRRLADFDTMIAQHVCFPGTPKGLDYLSSLYCDYHLYWKEDGKEWDPNVPEDQLWSYNCVDGVRTLEVAQEQNGLIDKLNLRPQFNEWMECADLGLQITQTGLLVDQQARTQMAIDLMQLREDIAIWCNKVMPFDQTKKSSWLTSPTQLAHIIYDEIGVQKVLHRKTKQPTVDEEALNIIAKREPLLEPIIDAIVHDRNTATIYNNFVARAFDSDGRFRPGVNVCGAETFRWSTSENAFGTGGNMQNVPKEESRKQRKFKQPNVRLLFKSDWAHELGDLDLAGADAQVVAWEADDEELKAAFRAGLKVHAKNALDMFGSSRAGADGRREPLYSQNKQAVHATDYGASARTVALTLGWTVHEAELWQRRWFSLHPNIKEWHRRVEAQLHATRTVSNRFGYRRVYFDRVESLLPQALAWIPQSTVAILTFRAALHLRRQVPWCKILMQVHDSLILQWPVSMHARLNEVRRCITLPVPYPDPLIIQWGLKTSKQSWGNVEDDTWPLAA